MPCLAQSCTLTAHCRRPAAMAPRLPTTFPSLLRSPSLQLYSVPKINLKAGASIMQTVGDVSVQCGSAARPAPAGCLAVPAACTSNGDQAICFDLGLLHEIE